MKKHRLFRSLAALLLAALLVFTSVPALADGAPATSYYMYVHTGNSGRLHLRALPTAQSASLGLYSNGTPVLVEGVTSGWAYVLVGGQRGFMALNFLSGATPVPPTPPAPPTPTEDTTLYISTGNSGKLHLREAPSQQARSLGLYPNGTSVQITARTGGWAYVHVAGITGYMMLQFLSTTPPVQPVPPAPAPEPGPKTAMVVQTGNSGKLHLRETPSQKARSLGLYPNGTAVQAANLGTGWSAVTVYGQNGYMMSKFLAPASSPVPPAPDPGPATDTVLYVNTGNSGKLHLRENISQDSASLGLYPNGTQVIAHAYIGIWAQVTVQGKNGYMMRQFLSETNPYPAPAPETPVTPVTPVTPGTATVHQPSNSFVYLRSTKSSASTANVLAKVPSGTVVDVIQWGNPWTLIRYAGMEGYMVTHYLQ